MEYEKVVSLWKEVAQLQMQKENQVSIFEDPTNCDHNQSDLIPLHAIDAWQCKACSVKMTSEYLKRIRQDQARKAGELYSAFEHLPQTQRDERDEVISALEKENADLKKNVRNLRKNLIHSERELRNKTDSFMFFTQLLEAAEDFTNVMYAANDSIDDETIEGIMEDLAESVLRAKIHFQSLQTVNQQLNHSIHQEKKPHANSNLPKSLFKKYLSIEHELALKHEEIMKLKNNIKDYPAF